ncbi:MAG: hypothetical protein J7604_06335 [Sporocytophaga sp.]|uniref:hypothetical protein n=1 Tax=Sporocytophaga sp. TaxID=2231183 RepID=UPI001B0A851F|nr:hypothetical protein [Sporocytophaga sp.]MBO9699810.1 hypothetical protein [Sporocytophaga sp.]
MKNVLLVLLILASYGCSGDRAKEKQVEKQSTKVKNDEFPEPPSKVFAKTSYDMDKNGKQDIFTLKGTYDVDTFEVLLNDKKYVFTSRCSVFTDFDDSIAIHHKLVRDKAFIFINADDKKFLLLKDMGDFAGPCYSLFGVSDNEIKEMWHTQNELTDIKDLDYDGIYEVVFHELIFEPADKGGYIYVNYPLYLVFKYSDDIFKKDEELTKAYNMEHNLKFIEYLEMKEPVLAKHSDSTSNELILIDLDTLKP